MFQQIESFWQRHGISLRQSTTNHTSLAFDNYLQSPKTPQDWFEGTQNHIKFVQFGYIWPTPEMNETSLALQMLKLTNVAAVRFSLNNLGKLSFEYLDDSKKSISNGPFDNLEDAIVFCHKTGINKVLKYNMSTEKTGVIAIEQNFTNIKNLIPFGIDKYSLGSSEINSSIEIRSLNNSDANDREKLQFLFLIDCSGSMSGQRMTILKKALVEVSKTVKSVSDVTINVIPFDDNLLYDEFPLTKKSINTLDKTFTETFEKMIESLSARHSTNFTKPINEGLRIVDKEREAHIVLFTDGYANDGLSSDHDLKIFIEKCIPKNVNFHIFGIGENYKVQTCLSMIEGHNVPSDSLLHLNEMESTVEVPAKMVSNVVNAFARYIKVKLHPSGSLKSKSPYFTWPLRNYKFTNLLFTRSSDTKFLEITLYPFTKSVKNPKKHYILALPAPSSDQVEKFLVDFEFSLLTQGDLTSVDEKTIKTLEHQNAQIPTTPTNVDRKLKIDKTLNLCKMSHGNQRTVNLLNITKNSNI